MRSRRIAFLNQGGQRLSGTLDLPATGQVSATAIFAHCFTCGRNLKPIVNINRALTAAGLAVLRFDFTGIGDSEGDFSATNLSTNRDDLLAAAVHLAKSLAPPSLLVGHSLGGAAAIQAAAALPSIKAVVTIAAPSEPSHVEGLLARKRDEVAANGAAELTLAGKTFVLRPQFFADLEATRMRETLRRLGRALLILHSPQDAIVPIRHAAAIFAAARHPKSFVSLDGADHLLLDERDARYAGAVIAAWVQRYL